MDVTPNRESVEATELRRLCVSIASSAPNSESETRTLAAILFALWEQGKGDSRVAGCNILRLIRVTSNYSAEVTTWAQAIGREWLMTSARGIAQTLTWGSGQPETTYSVILLSDQVGRDLLAIRDEGTATIIHELAHVHDDHRYLQRFGQLPALVQDDWRTIRLVLARSMWAEFFAEFIAYPHSTMIDEHLLLSRTLLEEAQAAIRQEATAYQSHRQVGKVWQVAVGQLSSVFDQFGRALGLLSAARASGVLVSHSQYFMAISKLSPEWARIVEKLAGVLLTLMEQGWVVGAFGVVEESVDEGFVACGLSPYP